MQTKFLLKCNFLQMDAYKGSFIVTVLFSKNIFA